MAAEAALKAVAALAALAFAAPASAQDADAVLKKLIDGPKAPFEGRVLSTHWAGAKAGAASEYEIRFSPPDRWRRDYLGGDGKPRAIVVSDGDKETVLLVSRGKALVGDAPRSLEKVMGAEREEALLRSNYTISVTGKETVAGRTGVALELVPLEAGKPQQRLVIDEPTGAVLANRRHLPGGRLAASATYVRFSAKEQDEDMFRAPTSSKPVEHSIDPDFMTMDAMSKELGRKVELPEKLSAGFEFESGDVLKVGKTKVAHARYTDGLAVVSIFELDKPVRAADVKRLNGSGGGGHSSGVTLSGPANAVRSSHGTRHVVLLSDVSRALLERIAAELRKAPPR